MDSAATCRMIRTFVSSLGQGGRKSCLLTNSNTKIGLSEMRCSGVYRGSWPFALLSRRISKMCRSTAQDNEQDYSSHYYDDEWQEKQRKKTMKLHRMRKEEEDEEEGKVEELREIASRFKGYPEKEVNNARQLVSRFIKAGEDVEEVIVEAADNGELSELVLLVIWNRLDVARQDDERHVIQALDLLYRRVETEMLKRNSSPAMHLLNELLNLDDGIDNEEWLRQCRTCMLSIFPREGALTIVAPQGMDLSEGPINLPPEDDDTLFRADFIREINQLLEELKGSKNSNTMVGSDPQSVAISLKLQEKERTIRQVKALRDLAISLKW